MDMNWWLGLAVDRSRMGESKEWRIEQIGMSVLLVWSSQEVSWAILAAREPEEWPG